eukprot:GFYU01023744.1.p1 GENE.GFYU01023744.1~~GFYU01023744.1.p1  ORF type:complete len:433 (+),score=122.40 GFYU01023744.1:94-1392(+)
MDFMNQFVEKQSAPLTVQLLKIRGNERTRASVLRRVLAPALEKDTLGSVTEELLICNQELQRLGIFHSVSITLEETGMPNVADVVVEVDEKSGTTVSTSTFVSHGEGSMEMSAALQNRLGYAEKLETTVSMGNKTSSLWKLAYVHPYFMGFDEFRLETYKVVNNFFQHSAHKEKVKGATASLSKSLLGFQHTFAADAAWREICQIVKPASYSIYREAGPSLKTSLKHTAARDTRDHPFVPESGSCISLDTEYAGGIGDVKFFKQELQLQKSIPLFMGMVWGVGANAGYVLPIEGAEYARINDRFFVGGPSSLRNFRTKGVGQRDGKFSLGGNMYWTAATSVSVPIPHALLYALRWRVHAYANAGNVQSFEKETSMEDRVRSLAKEDVRVTAGIGLVIPTFLGRVELNYGLYCKKSELDREKKMQLGVGVNVI